MRNIFYNFETHLFNFCYCTVCCTLYETGCTLKNASEGTFTPSSCISFFKPLSEFWFLFLFTVKGLLCLCPHVVSFSVCTYAYVCVSSPFVVYDSSVYVCIPSPFVIHDPSIYVCISSPFVVHNSSIYVCVSSPFAVHDSNFYVCISSPFVVHDSAIVPHSSHVHQLLPTANDTKHF